jgi:anti-sigma factor RsiW
MTHIDVKAYAVGEMNESDKRAAAAHVGTCESCREELAGLQATLGSLAMLRDEDAPRRIAFVSDKVFEPKWWQRLNPMVASACLIAAAIVAHGFAVPSPVDASVQTVIDQAVQREVALRMELLDQKDKEMTQRYKAVMNLVTY